MKTWLIVLVGLLGVGYSATAVEGYQPVLLALTVQGQTPAQEFYQLALYPMDLPLSSMFAVGLITVAFYMRTHLDSRSKERAGDS